MTGVNGALKPSFERLLMSAFTHLAPGRVTVLTTDAEEGQPRFEIPAAWRATQDSSWQDLPAIATRLLKQGPLLLLPPWQRHPRLLPAPPTVVRPCTCTTTCCLRAVLQAPTV